MIIRMIIVTAMMKAMEIMMIVITTVLKTIYNMTITVIMSIVMGDDRWTMMDFDGWMRRMKTTRLHFINIRNHRVLAAFSIVTFSVVVAEFSVFPVRNVVLEK